MTSADIATTRAAPGAPQAPGVPAAPRRRDPFYDVIRAVALVRVVAWHAFQWPVLSYIAAMPVMFFVGGTMARASFARRTCLATIGARLRRLLPPLWAYGTFAWAALLVTGLATTGALIDPPWRLLWWLVPLGDPTGPDAALAWWAPLWYLRAYLWLVLATPLLVRAQRRYGALRLLAATGAVATAVALVTTQHPDVLPVPVHDFALFGSFWVLGLAGADLRDHALVRSWRVRIVAALAFGAAGAAWMVVRPVPLGIVNAAPMAELLFGAAWVVGLTAFAPSLRRLGERRAVAPTVAWFNRRAVTIYLWHCAAIAIVHEVLGAPEGLVPNLAFAVAVVAGTGLFVTLAGPIEDLAAKARQRTTARSRPASRRWSVGITTTALAGFVLLLAALPIIDLRTTGAEYVPASGRGLDRLIAADTDTSTRPEHLTPVVRRAGPVQAGEVARVVAHWRDDWDMSGVVAAVGRSDGTTLDAASGIDHETQRAMRRQQPIPAHSITKSFTGALVAQLHAERLLDLDERLAVWVPEFPHASRMTLRQLAQHSSGLVDTGESPAVGIEIAGSTPLKFEPGEGTAYADSNYFLLAVAAERATGATYEQLVHDRLLAPLGLHHTTLDDGTRWSAGGMTSTAADLARWATVFWGGGLGNDVAVEARTLDPQGNFGIGTFGYCPCDGTGPDYVAELYGHLSGQGRLAWDPVDDLAVMIHTDEVNDGGRTIDAWNDLDHRLRELTADRALAPRGPAAVTPGSDAP